MKKKGNKELKSFLQGTLHELTRLADQIRTTRDYSEQAELILCLKEIITEQIEGSSVENSGHTTHPAR